MLCATQTSREGIKRAVAEHKPKLLFLTSPNNPDGSIIPNEQIVELLKLPVVVVLDQAYIEFADPAGDWTPMVTDYPNLIVLRTFSKWAGLAGMRVGYGAIPSGLIPFFWKIKQPYNISVSAATAALTALQHKDEIQVTVEAMLSERERLIEQLNSIEYLRTYPTQTNFVLCQVSGKDALEVKNELANRGILIRYFNKPGLRDHIRISVGKPEHTDALIAALRELE
jgi:histidinol-phosphate aminotransferase